MNEDKYTLESGVLKVDQENEIYYQRWGNPKSEPIFFLHGGPGSGLKDSHKLFFDPKKHQLIFHDQRGCGKSIPFGVLEANTTQNLVEDIESLRMKFKFNKISLFGGSWGACLALVYACMHPDRVNRMLINGIYTGTKDETDYIQQGGLATHFPESWEQYIEVVPEDMRSKTVEYYQQKMQSDDTNIANDHIRRWNINESSAISIDPDIKSTILKNSEIDDIAKSIAIMEAHYFVNNCFLPDYYILNSSDKLKGINLVMVQGRFDHICPPKTAYKLAEAIGDSCHLHITPGGHAKESTFREVISAYVWAMFG